MKNQIYLLSSPNFEISLDNLQETHYSIEEKKKITDFLCNKDFIEIVIPGDYIKSPITNEEVPLFGYAYSYKEFNWSDYLLWAIMSNNIELPCEFTNIIHNYHKETKPQYSWVQRQRIR